MVAWVIGKGQRLNWIGMEWKIEMNTQHQLIANLIIWIFKFRKMRKIHCFNTEARVVHVGVLYVKATIINEFAHVWAFPSFKRFEKEQLNVKQRAHTLWFLLSAKLLAAFLSHSNDGSFPNVDACNCTSASNYASRKIREGSQWLMGNRDLASFKCIKGDFQWRLLLFRVIQNIRR